MAQVAGQVLTRRTLAAFLGSAAAGALLPRLASPALGQDTDVEEMVQALRRRRRRGDPAEPSETPAILERFKEIRRQRGLNLQEREELAKITDGNPRVDLTVYFALDSAQIEPQAATMLGRLGMALGRPELEGQGFGIFGHTDRKGSAEYNQVLSERRAEAVRQHLVANFSVNPDLLLPVGYGFERPKNPSNPFADENRRVQIVNLRR